MKSLQFFNMLVSVFMTLRLLFVWVKKCLLEMRLVREMSIPYFLILHSIQGSKINSWRKFVYEGEIFIGRVLEKVHGVYNAWNTMLIVICLKTLFGIYKIQVSDEDAEFSHIYSRSSFFYLLKLKFSFLSCFHDLKIKLYN